MGVPLALWLFVSLLALNALQVASLLVWPLSRAAFRSINRRLAGLYWGMCVALSRRVWGIRVVITGDPLPPREDVVLVANHQQMADITFLMFLARLQGRIGDMKWVLKKALRWAPGMGWGLSFLGCVFVARDWMRDQATIRRTFEALRAHRVPTWMMSFPEGTRLTPAKLAASQAWQRAQGTAPLAHVLAPRTKGFVACVRGLAGHADAVYDVTIGYREGVPSLWQYIKGYARVAHLHVERTPLAELPVDDQALAAWLVARFAAKDARLAAFYAGAPLGA